MGENFDAYYHGFLIVRKNLLMNTKKCRHQQHKWKQMSLSKYIVVELKSGQLVYRTTMELN